jgi:hypothetical protein
MDLKFRLEGFSALPRSLTPTPKRSSVAVDSARNKSGTQILQAKPSDRERSRQRLQLAAMDPAMLAIFGLDAIPIGS